MKLSQKLLYLFFTFFIVLFVLQIILVRSVETGGIRKQLRSDFNALVRDMANEGDHLISNNNQGNIYLVFKDKLERTNMLTRLLYLRIIDENGKIYHSFKEKDEEFRPTRYRLDKTMQQKTTAETPFVASTLSSNLGDVYDVNVRFENEKGVFWLRCGFLLGTETNVDFSIFVILVIFLGLLAIFFVIVNNVIVRPLEQLRDEALQIALGAGGDFSLPKFRDDEIGDLSRALDNLVRELQAKQKKLTEQERLAVIGRSTGRLTHNISNLLNPLDNAFQQIHNALGDGEGQAKEALDTIERHFQLVQHDLRRLRHAIPDEPNREAYPLSILVKTALSRTIVPQNIKVIERNSAGGRMVLVDPEQMTVVIYNILINAIQAMPSGGVLTITTNTQRNRALIEISDTGIGISDEQQKSLFQFFQSTKKDGMGIGLAASLEIVRNHNGIIRVTSAVGNGSTFIIDLPLMKE